MNNQRQNNSQRNFFSRKFYSKTHNFILSKSNLRHTNWIVDPFTQIYIVALKANISDD